MMIIKYDSPKNHVQQYGYEMETQKDDVQIPQKDKSTKDRSKKSPHEEFFCKLRKCARKIGLCPFYDISKPPLTSFEGK